MTLKRNFTVFALIVATSAGLSGCASITNLNPFKGKASGNKVQASAGERISIIAFDEQLNISDALKGVDFYLPDAVARTDWPLPGGTPEQSVEHLAAGANLDIVWKRAIGKGSDRRVHLTAPPISAEGVIFTMDAEAGVSAHSVNGGAEVWSTNLALRDRRDREAFGGGLAYADGKVFVTSGYRFIAGLDAKTGALLWKTPVEAPIHAAPTVSGGRLFVVSTDNELLTVDTATGALGWNYQALVEPARILEATSAAISGDTVIAGFASGELIALRTGNGNDIWSEVLSRASRTNALSEIRDIPGRPVIYRGDVFAVSHSGVFAATDLRTGTARWSLPISGISTPLPIGDVVYVVSKPGEVICVSRETGQVYWIVDLNKDRKKKQRAAWSGPVLASNRLIIVSSTGELVALNPKTGALEKTVKLGTPALLSPIAVNDTLYLVGDKGVLLAIR
jgi:outer membrane protein assembly factor BamB